MRASGGDSGDTVGTVVGTEYDRYLSGILALSPLSPLNLLSPETKVARTCCRACFMHAHNLSFWDARIWWGQWGHREFPRYLSDKTRPHRDGDPVGTAGTLTGFSYYKRLRSPRECNLGVANGGGEGLSAA